MVILHFKADKFFSFLMENGCKQLTDEFVEKDNFVVFEKDGMEVPIQIQKIYYPRIVCKICEYFDINPPPDFEKVRDQLNRARDMSGEHDES